MTVKKTFVAPALPIPPTQYDQRHQENIIRTLRLYFNLLDNFLVAISVPESGPTADRPITNLAIGQQFFDTTLGIPIWYDGTNWVDATGATV